MCVCVKVVRGVYVFATYLLLYAVVTKRVSEYFLLKEVH